MNGSEAESPSGSPRRAGKSGPDPTFQGFYERPEISKEIRISYRTAMPGWKPDTEQESLEEDADAEPEEDMELIKKQVKECRERMATFLRSEKEKLQVSSNSSQLEHLDQGVKSKLVDLIDKKRQVIQVIQSSQDPGGGESPMSKKSAYSGSPRKGLDRSMTMTSESVRNLSVFTSAAESLPLATSTDAKETEADKNENAAKEDVPEDVLQLRYEATFEEAGGMDGVPLRRRILEAVGVIPLTQPGEEGPLDELKKLWEQRGGARGKEGHWLQALEKIDHESDDGRDEN